MVKQLGNRVNRLMLFVWLGLTFGFYGPGITHAKAQQTFSVSFYNLENLFDTVDDPLTDDADFLPEGKLKWTEERYRRKLENMAAVINELNPDVFGVCELENAAALQDLLQQGNLQGYRMYQYLHYESPDPRGIDVAFVYDAYVFNPIDKRSISVPMPDGKPTRDILLVMGSFRNKISGRKDTIAFMVNHWPSRRNPESHRLAAAKAAKAAADSVLKLTPNLILMGDFNDTPTNNSILSMKTVDDASKCKAGMFLNPMHAIQNAGLGSYWYKNAPELLDQFLVSCSMTNTENNLHYVPYSAFIFTPDWLQEGVCQPKRTYSGPKYIGGYSDHFPISLKLFSR